LGLGSVLHVSLEPGHGVSEVSRPLGLLLLFGLVLHKLALVPFLFLLPSLSL
jgi:hypothetical protein